MRISGGHLKGRTIGSQRIFSKKSRDDELRPTSSKVRQAIFNILRNEIQDSSFLDLYAGSGAVGVEALSRGARQVVFAEQNRLRAKHIAEVLLKTGADKSATVFQGKTMEFLKKAGGEGMKFDIIFADPPYASEETAEVVAFIEKYGILDGMGALLVEHSSKKMLPESVGRLRSVKNYRYGDTMLSLYRREA